ncbi:MAG: beta-galactosidase [bacterium]|jgi:hypothetical protein|nr:beta-galactosidase [bacterium]
MKTLLALVCICIFALPVLAESPHVAFPNGLSPEATYFPIGVWLQNPANAVRYKEAGINLYIGLWQGPTDEQLDQLKAQDIRVICGWNQTAQRRMDDPVFAGWMHQDEPDNAQPVTDPQTGKQSYGPPVKPETIVADYEEMKQRDPTRPIFLNLGQGVANDEWVGRGPGAQLSDYETYIKGCDIVSYDIYPITDLRREDGEDYLWLIAKGLDRLTRWTDGEKPIWNVIECTHINNPNQKPTPNQVKSEVWMSLIHGSKGIIYFVHEFQPKFNEKALLDDPQMLEAVTAINQQIHTLAPILNQPSLPEGITVESSNPEVPIAFMAKEFEGALYLFAINMRNIPVSATFSFKQSIQAIEDMEEERTIPISQQQITDTFSPYQVRMYKGKTD